MKPRRVDFYFDELIAGTVGMNREKVGIYWLTITFMYSTGGALHVNDTRVARHCGANHTTVRRLWDELVMDAKLERHGDLISNRRVLDELAKATSRIDQAQAAGKMGGRPPTKTDTYGNRPVSPPVLKQFSETKSLPPPPRHTPPSPPPSGGTSRLRQDEEGPKPVGQVMGFQDTSPQPPSDDSSSDIDATFNAIWARWPNQDRESRARAALWGAITRGVHPKHIVAGAQRFVDSLGDKGDLRRRTQLVNWLAEERWGEAPAAEGEVGGERKLTEAELEAAAAKAAGACAARLAAGESLQAWQLPSEFREAIKANGTTALSADDLRAACGSAGIEVPGWLVDDGQDDLADIPPALDRRVSADDVPDDPFAEDAP